MHLLKLTEVFLSAGRSNTIYVNPAQILYIRCPSENNPTSLALNDSAFILVQETPDEILHAPLLGLSQQGEVH